MKLQRLPFGIRTIIILTSIQHLTTIFARQILPLSVLVISHSAAPLTAPFDSTAGIPEELSPAELYTESVQGTLRGFLYYKRQAQVFTLIPARSHKLLSFIYFYSFSFAFLSARISSAISTSVFSSFGRMIFRMIANSAAGTIPEPPKIRLILSGSCASTAELEPSP